MTLAALFVAGLAVAISMAIGAWVLRFTAPSLIRRPLGWALIPGFGMAICSINVFFFRRPMFTTEFALVGVLAIAWLMARPLPAGIAEARRGLTLDWILLAVATLFGAYVVLRQIDLMPHGDWDAWAIWNVHARMMFRDGPNWLTSIAETEHADYPLLTPAYTVRLWRYLADDIPVVASLPSLILGVACVALLSSLLNEARRGLVARTAAIILVSTPFWLNRVASQMADVPLAYYFLGATGLLALAARPREDKRILIGVAGFLAASAAWTKNEGLLFLCACMAGLVVQDRPLHLKSIWHRLRPFACGAALPFVAVAAYKLVAPMGNDLVSNQGLSITAQRLMDLQRYRDILSFSGPRLLEFGLWTVHPGLLFAALVGALGVKGLTARQDFAVALRILVMMGAGYFFVYVTSPHSLLEFHLPSSLDRLLIHLLPMALLTAGLAASESSDAAEKKSPLLNIVVKKA